MTTDTDLLAGSAETWWSAAPEPRVPAEPEIDRSLSPRQRLAAWKARHRLRAQRAATGYARSRNPERGLPVAGARSAFVFIGALLRPRVWRLVAMVGFNGLAALGALLVPWLVGDVVDAAAAGSAGTAVLEGKLLAVAALGEGQGLARPARDGGGGRAAGAPASWQPGEEPVLVVDDEDRRLVGV